MLEMHHWSYPELNATDTDDLIPYLVYYPEWKKRLAGAGSGGGAPARQQVYADEVIF